MSDIGYGYRIERLNRPYVHRLRAGFEASCLDSWRWVGYSYSRTIVDWLVTLPENSERYDRRRCEDLYGPYTYTVHHGVWTFHPALLLGRPLVLITSRGMVAEFIGANS